MAKKGKLRMLWRNLKFLMRTDLRFGLADMAGCRCKLADMLRTTKMPAILDFEETAERLATSERSLARFGDGEFAVVEGRSIAFQRADAGLARRLREILRHPPEGCDVAIPRVGWFMDARLKPADHAWWFRFMREKGAFVESLLDPSRTYCDTYVSQFTQATVEGYDCAALFARLRRIWDGKDVLVVCGRGIFDGFTHDVFDNARSVECIYGPKRDAWDVYDALLAQVKAAAQGRVVLVVLGPTATVMAADLAAAGIRALDLGHLAKAYEAFLTGAMASRAFFKAE
jgi:glycosyltransferase family protein